jgi:toxin ParE1/3/4
VTAYRITETAKADFAKVLRETREQFGAPQREVYRRLITQGVKMVAADPERGSSWDRGTILPGLRAFHLEHAAGRRGAAAHMLYYAVERGSDGAVRVIILRLLHESMEPRLHIARSPVGPPPQSTEPEDEQQGDAFKPK